MKKIYFVLLGLAGLFWGCGLNYYDSVRTYRDEVFGTERLELACRTLPEIRHSGLHQAQWVFEKTLRDTSQTVMLRAEFLKNLTQAKVDSTAYFLVDDKPFLLHFAPQKTAIHQSAATYTDSTQTQLVPPSYWATDILKTQPPIDLLRALGRSKKVRVQVYSDGKPILFSFSEYSIEKLRFFLSR